MPSGAIRVAFVLAHQADRSESNRGIATDRSGVIGSGIDHEAVVASTVYQEARERGDRVAAESSAMNGGVEEDIDPRVAVPRVGLLVILDHAAKASSASTANL